ncbi:MAG: trigger factor [Candidatus Eremiobacteraeota bacterium]|nr:trigger factor [Candidatus Eremiobacteraeota bacterium]
MTSSTLTRLAPTQVALEFSITGQEIAAAEERAFRKLAKNVRLPGFRKGKVPRKIFEQNYGTDALTREAMDEVVPQVYAKAIAEHDLQPVERPTLEILEEDEGRPTRVKATVEVRPPIELRNYKGVAVSRPATPVTEADVESSLRALAKERATLVPVQRAAALGDVATLDYAGTVDGAPFEGGTASGQVTELSEGRFIPGFVAGIVGMTPGEKKSIDVTFPDDYSAPHLAGKPARFDVTLQDLKEYELPALDDEFAKAVSPHHSVDELRADVRRRLEAVAAARARRIVANAVMTQVLAAHEFPLPASMVESELDRLVEETPPAGESGKSDAGERRQSLRAEAESRVKASLLIEAIAKAEEISATPADVAAELEALSRRYGQPAARIRSALGNNVFSLMDGIVRNKTLDFLVDNAVVTVNEETSGPAS